METLLKAPVNPRLLLTRSTLHRHAKRLRDEFALQGSTVNLAAAQEALARTLGWKNWHEAILLTSPPNITNAGSHDVPLFPARVGAPTLYTGPHTYLALLEFLAASQRAGYDRWWFEDGILSSSAPLSGHIHRLTPIGASWNHGEVQDLLVDLGAVTQGHHQVPFSEFVCSSSLENGAIIRLAVGVVELIDGETPVTRVWFKAVPEHAPDLSILGLPPLLRAHLLRPHAGLGHAGLGIVSAACAVAGVTTTLNAMTRRFLETQAGSVLMFEDYPEYDYAALSEGRAPVLRQGLSSVQLHRASALKPALAVVDAAGSFRHLDDLLDLSAQSPVWANFSRGHGVPDILRRLMSMSAPDERLARWEKLWTTLSVVVVQDRSIDGQLLWEYLIVDDQLRADMRRRSSIPEALVVLQTLLEHRHSRFIDNARAGPGTWSEEELLRREKSHEQSERWREANFLRQPAPPLPG